MQVCADHVTILAFTGRSWCPHCQAIEPAMQQLQKSQGRSFHFRQIDTEDADSAPIIKHFQVQGFPTILVFDGKTRVLKQYAGERSQNALQLCAENMEKCNTQQYQNISGFQCVPHASIPTVPETPPPAYSGPLELCADLLTVLAFTGKNWCPHCQVAQPTIDSWKKPENASTLGFRVVQFDTDDSKERIEDFGIDSFPSFLIFDPNTRVFTLYDGKVDDLPKRIHETNRQVWTKVPEEVKLVSCQIAGAGTMAVVAVEIGPAPMELELCAQCPTILAFTGESWCPPCQVFAPQLVKMHSYQKHGTFHLLQFDRVADPVDGDDNAMWCEKFQIKSFPTILIFNPYDRTFYHHTGIRQAEILMKCDTRGAKVWPSPENVRIVLRKEPVTVTRVKVQVEAETNGELHVCDSCPTVMVFCMHENTLPHLTASTNPSLHVMHMYTSRDSRLIDLFGVHIFPTILIYLPDQSVFIIYEGHLPTTAAIIKFLQTRNTKKHWKMHPRVVQDKTFH